MAALDLSNETRVFIAEHSSAGTWNRIRMYSTATGFVDGAVGTGALNAVRAAQVLPCEHECAHTGEHAWTTHHES